MFPLVPGIGRNLRSPPRAAAIHRAEVDFARGKTPCTDWLSGATDFTPWLVVDHDAVLHASVLGQTLIGLLICNLEDVSVRYLGVPVFGSMCSHTRLPDIP